MSASADRLSHVDEHSTTIDADPSLRWDALLRTTEAFVSSGAAPRFARLLGCADALVFRLDDLGGDRTRLRAETRAEFPGLKGRAYRAMVIGTRGHSAGL